MMASERQIQWLFSDLTQLGRWSPSGHRNGQLVSETAYLVANV
jgi:hypothetical protein